MDEQSETQRDGTGAVIQAAEVPGPTFTNVVEYATLKAIANSQAFMDLRSQAKEREVTDDAS